MYLGDFKEDGDLFFKFTTRAFATGVPFALASGVLSVYIDEATATEKTSGEAYFDLDVNFDGKTGLNNVRIDLAGDAFFATEADYSIVITTGTVDSVSVVGEVVATFSIENRYTRGTDDAALAVVVGALADVAGTNEVDAAKSLMQYVKQLINILVGAPGVTTLKAAAAPASGVSLSEMIRAIYDDTNGLIDGNGRVDIGRWLGTAVTLSTGNQPDVNVDRIDDVVVSTVATDGKLHVLDDAGATVATEAKQDIMDTVVDSILEDTGTTLPAEHVTIVNLLSTEIAEILADTDELQGDWTNGGRLDLIIDAINTVTSALTASAAAKLAASAETMILGTVGATDLTTTTCSTDISLTDAEQLNGRIIIFRHNTSTNGLKYQATDITDFVVANGVLTFTAVTTAPSAGDTLVVV